MSKRIILLGCGGHGRVLLDALLSADVKVAGIVDPGLKAGDEVFGVPVLGGDEAMDRFPPSEILLVNGVGANPDIRRRRELFESLKKKGFSFHPLRETSAVIGRECVLGEGSQVMAGAVLQNRVRIGENAVVNTRASIDHDCAIGPHAFISPGAVLCGDVKVSEAAFVGAGTIVLPGIEIGKGSVIGAGAVVTKAVPSGWIVAGNPAVKTGMDL